MIKKFKLNDSQIEKIAVGFGSCIASDLIAVQGLKVGFMYREEPENDHDSGWRFLSGQETQDYADNADNFAFYDINTIANYDPRIVNHIESQVGSEIEEDECGQLVKLNT